MTKLRPKMSNIEAVEKFAGKIYTKRGMINRQTVKRIAAIFGIKVDVYYHSGVGLCAYVDVPKRYEGIADDTKDYALANPVIDPWGGNPKKEVENIYGYFQGQFERWENRLAESVKKIA